MRILHPLFASVLLVEALCAQAPDAAAHAAVSGQPAPAPDPILRSAFGAFAVEGETCAAGPGYAARFVGSGIEFTPALGERAPRRLPVSFVLESIRRGTRTLLAAEALAPVREGNFVRYARGSGIVESYEARPDGIEQTFHFASRPAGTGDLVVRGRVTTELAVAAGDAAAGIRFEMPEVGGVSWGGVTGSDATGDRVTGNLRLDGGHLELALPGEFVDRATFPLLLDPLIGSILVVAGGATNDYLPDVAYDATYARYLAVWHRRYSSTNRAVLGQLFSVTGTPFGSLFAITPLTGNYHSATVASVNTANRFLVANVREDAIGWAWFDFVEIRAINALDGGMSARWDVTAGSLGTRTDVGGNNTSLTSTACVIAYGTWGLGWYDVHVPPAGNPVIGYTVVVTSSNVVAATVNNHSGTAGRFLVAWQTLAANGMHDVHGRVVDLNGALLTPATAIAANVVVDEAAPACATRDGVTFAIVYELRAAGPSGNSDIAGRTARYDATAGTLVVGAERIVAGGLLQDQVTPTIDFAATKYLVAWASFANLGGGWNLYSVGLAPDNCVPCEQVTAIDTSAATADHLPRIAAMYSGSSTANDEAVVVWESTETSTDVKAQRVQAMGSGGAVTALGGGCGAGGTAGVNGPVALGNAGFAFTLSGNGGPAFGLILGVGTANFACGPCTQVPAADFVHIGSPPYPLPIPCNVGLIGLPLHGQWLVLSPGPCPLATFFSLSQAVRVVIGV